MYWKEKKNHQFYQLTIKPNMLSQFKLMKTNHIGMSLFH